ncbi:hypothetical protein [Undibacterium flavidum]|uniref:PH (Pleckstrin Homology) domain-containing protein n=1 Tax=Undibacterium flavidum TaxID=2762297 RepID=A0ABR6YG72_9BURK|nr:hypothetical protein [Undibacterium flavidum]MBC3875565.1 hypothetical protein [Undibacterium flavidum]
MHFKTRHFAKKIQAKNIVQNEPLEKRFTEFVRQAVTIGTPISGIVSVAYLWLYLTYIGRQDQLLPALSNAKGLLALFGASLLYFPLLIFAFLLPGIFTYLSYHFLKKHILYDDKIPHQLMAMCLTAVTLTVLLEVARRVAMDKYFHVPAWGELALSLPLLMYFSLHRYRKQHKKENTYFSFQQELYFCTLGVIGWLVVMLVCVPLSQTLRDTDVGNIRKIFDAFVVSVSLLTIAPLFVRLKQRCNTSAELIKTMSFATISILIIVLLFSPKVYGLTLKKVAYSLGMREKGTSRYILNAKYFGHDLTTDWKMEKLNGDFYLVTARNLFTFGDTAILCPSNYKDKSSTEIRERARNECLALPISEIHPWWQPYAQQGVSSDIPKSP